MQTVDLHLMLHDVVQRKKFYTLVLQKCLTRSRGTVMAFSYTDKQLNELKHGKNVYSVNAEYAEKKRK